MRPITRRRARNEEAAQRVGTRARFGCPTCKAHERGDIIQQADVGANYGGEFDEDGRWQDDGNGADMLWDVVSVHGFYCRKCGADFEKPVKIG